MICTIAIGCSVGINFGLKHVMGKYMKSDWTNRPDTADTSGMPSGHAQTMALIGLFFTCMVIHNNKQSWYLPVVALWILVISVCWQRVYMKQHTTEQVIVGFAIGSVLGIGTYLLTKPFNAAKSNSS